LGAIYALLGVLSKGHFVETDRSGLVGGYLGQTALKTKEVLESALGGILFIDEAYALSSSDGSDQYGQEAIDTLLKYMEDHRDDIVVIAAGYEQEMNRFMESNPGLKSRFNKYFYFQDYADEELMQIFLSICADSGYTVHKDALPVLGEVIDALLRLKTRNFGNGRTMRNLFEKTIANQANRIVLLESAGMDDLAVLTKEDFRWDDVRGLS
jgi:SpoVK/Ycf46/Vps4 family AAA+-type ATPase